MTTTELYCKGAKVWTPNPEKVWEGAELLEDYSPKTGTLQIITESKQKKALTIKSNSDLPPLRNPQILIGENDLTSLSYLHEPAVLYNLQVRFCQQKSIYTYCGIVLVAINPYDDLSIYGSDTIEAYRGQAMGDLDPHIFAVSEEAYTKLERENRDQSIIVSGESGAGKTVSAKYAMRYFATVGGSTNETQVEKKVLASSPIMEAIGNAKTTRNDNSSRFGKYIEIQFNKQFHIMGASMRTYLLEKSRVVFQAPEERNYHIFYQLCASRGAMPELQLDHQNKFMYLNQGQSPEIDGVNDAATFEETKNALTTLGFSDREQSDMFRILASILHLGNIKFTDAIIRTENEQAQEGVMIKKDDKHIQVLSELLQIDHKDMRQWLCTRKIVSMREVFLKPMSKEQAIMSRDALAKHIYAEVFNWIVLVVNKALETTGTRHKFIGVLDIYGFETFDTNSFEQFCINYANEKLQQQFNQHVFKLEQEEYIKEEIEWKMIDFYDNQPCIDLIETKLGILDLLDEECRMPKGTDSSWTEKLYSKCIKYKHFAKARFGTTAFMIKHFADLVQYESTGFLEKNRDTVIEEQIHVLRSSQNKLVKRLFSDDDSKLPVPGTKLKIVSAKPVVATQKSHKKSVGSQFRDSLNMLMATLNATTPHYVRCIKPNDSKQAFDYNPVRAVQQLRACGVLETIRISAAGFPSRWSYLDFFQRYRVLCKFSDINRDNMQKTCQRILEKNIKTSDQYQFGKTKIFFRAGQVAYLEKLRADKLRHCCIVVQSQIRAFIWRKKYMKLKKSVRNIQRYGRGLLARRLANSIRRTRAAIKIQKYVRCWVKRVQYQRLRSCVLGLQAYSRGYLARLRFLQMKYNAKAIIIQRHVRGWLARIHYKKEQQHIVICQSAIRRFLARRLFKKLRVEARSIEHVKKLNKGLENKIISMQQKIQELNKESHILRNVQSEVIDLKAKLEGYKALEIEMKKMNTLLNDKNKQISALEENLKIERDEKMDLIEEQEKYKRDSEEQSRCWAEETSKLRKELDNMNEIVQTNQKGAEENLKTRIEQEKLLLINEQDQDRDAYQKLLQEYHNLEQYCEGLEKQVSKQTKHGHIRNISDISVVSGMDESIACSTEDFGYGSVRSTASSLSTAHAPVENIDWRTNESPNDTQGNSTHSTSEPNVDLSLVLKLQHKLAEVERERNRLRQRLDEIDASPSSEQADTRAQDSYRISELEVENASLKKQLKVLRESIGNGSESRQLVEQFSVLQEELDRRREECIQLRSVLANQTANLKTIAIANYGPGVDMINEDGELVLAYETQKKINKQLELELQDQKNIFKSREKEYKFEIEKLREDNERQQKLLSVNLTKSPTSQTEAYMQHELTRLTSENLDLQEKVDTVTENYRKYKKNAKYLAKKLKDAGLLDGTMESDATKTEQFLNEQQAYLPIVRKKDGGYLGMFEYSKGDETVIVRHLVTDLKPRTAVTLVPGLPAYIFFMCIRHTDFINDDNKVRDLLTAFINSVKKVIKKRHEDFETTVLWLSNTLRLLHNLKQYSGDKAFQNGNTPKQNEQSLRNFDLSEYRQVLSDIAVWIYQGIIRILEDKIQILIIPAILEHEAITGMGGIKPAGMRGRSSSLSRDLESPVSIKKAPQILLQELSNFYKVLGFYGVDPEVTAQVVKQLFYFICASSLNNLLLRKDLCHWSKGTQIRHNLSHLEVWTRDRKLEEQPILDTLKPIIEAAHLLQARKTDEDVDSICEMCSTLTAQQICKILTLYTPADDYEPRVPTSFITKVKTKLAQKSENQEPKPLLMDIKYNYPVRFPFNPSTVCLEDIEVPEILNLPMLKKV